MPQSCSHFLLLYRIVLHGETLINSTTLGSANIFDFQSAFSMTEEQVGWRIGWCSRETFLRFCIFGTGQGLWSQLCGIKRKRGMEVGSIGKEEIKNWDQGRPRRENKAMGIRFPTTCPPLMLIRFLWTKMQGERGSKQEFPFLKQPSPADLSVCWKCNCYNSRLTLASVCVGGVGDLYANFGLWDFTLIVVFQCLLL